MYPDLLESRLVGERMRRLPQECAPPMDWEQFQRQMASLQSERSVTASRAIFRWRYAALAAGIAALVAGLAVWSRFATPAFTASTSSAQAELPRLARPDKQSLAQAEVSERWLARLPVEPAVMRVGTRTAVADLEDRIAWMDDVLSAERLDAVDRPRIVALQRERARMVNSLAQVRYAETLVAAAQ